MHWNALRGLTGKSNTYKESIALIDGHILNEERCPSSLRTTLSTSFKEAISLPSSASPPKPAILKDNGKTIHRFSCLENIKYWWHLSPQTPPCSEEEMVGTPPSKQGPGKLEGRQLERRNRRRMWQPKGQFSFRDRKHISQSRMLQSPLSTDVINP